MSEPETFVEDENLRETDVQTEMQSEEVNVTLTSSGFSPRTITVNKGTKVVWTNQSGRPATVNSAPHPAHTSYPPLNLGSFSNGETVELVFDTPGTYNYHDHLNASLTGSVIVEE